MEYVLDAEKLNDREEAHEYLAKVFSLPEYYGKNLDALYILFRSYFHHFIFELTDLFFCFRYAAIDSF